MHADIRTKSSLVFLFLYFSLFSRRNNCTSSLVLRQCSLQKMRKKIGTIRKFSITVLFITIKNLLRSVKSTFNILLRQIHAEIRAKSSLVFYVEESQETTVPLLWCSVNVVLASFRLYGEEEGDEVILQLLHQGETSEPWIP
jgi:hypothetical protein